MKFNIIAALDTEHGIGKNNSLPWRISADLQYFKQLTLNACEGKQNAVIMGRKTWDSLPEKMRPLKNRLNIIISSQANLASGSRSGSDSKSGSNIPDQFLVAHSLHEAFKLCSSSNIDQIFVIGGSQIYNMALKHPALDKVYLTEVSGSHNCDCFFPEFGDILTLVSSSDLMQENEHSFQFKVYTPNHQT